MPSLATRILSSDTLAALAAPHGVDRYLEAVNPMWAAREVRARIVSIHRETEIGAPVATITFQPTDTWTGFVAGQHVQLGIEIAGARRTTRAFSISSGQSGPGRPFTVTLRANPDGVVSRFLVEQARPGQIVHLSQAEGDFVLPAQLPDRLLFVSGGSGITPVMSMLRTLVADGYDGQITFLHYAQSPGHQIFAEELDRLDSLPQVDVRRVHGDWFDESHLPVDWAGADIWACGPAPMIELVQQVVGDRARLRVEFFKVPTTGAGRAGDEAAAEGDVSFDRSGIGAANTGKTLLEQAEDLGLRPEFGCRMGICFSCTRTKVTGTVRHVISGDESSLPGEDIQLCVQTPVGDCAIDL